MGCFLCMVFMANAQTDKGNLLLGGDASFILHNSKWKLERNTGEIEKNKGFEFFPKVGFFVADNLAMGVEVPISYLSKETDQGIRTKSMTSLLCFMRHYFDTDIYHLKTYLHAGIGSGRMSEKFDSGIGPYPKPNVEGFLLSDLSCGLAFFLGEKITLDIGLGYSSISKKSKEYDGLRTISSGFASTMGFIIVL